MRIFQLIQNIQQDISNLKAFSNYEKNSLNKKQTMNKLKRVIKNLEDHLEDLIKDILN